MQNRYLLFTGLTLVALAFMAIHSFEPSQAQHSATDTYAITNARIVPVTGPTIDKGTIVIRDGLIAAIGANVAAPADARVIDGAGLSVYPGLIDTNTSLGLPQASPSPAGAARGGGGGFGFQAGPGPMASALNSSQPAGLQPEIRAEDYIRSSARIGKLKFARRSGLPMK